MDSVVIHRTVRADRQPAVEKLAQQFPGLQVFEALTPKWEVSPHNMAVRGCSVSHLFIVRNYLKDKPLLVLEDDAEMLEDCNIDLTNVPEDAGIILYGADVEEYGPDQNGFREVLPKFWGSHAVVYLPKLLKTDFLLNALSTTSIYCLGRHRQGTGLCYESVLFLAMAKTGLKIYRPNKMGFTTIESVSDSGDNVGQRVKALVATDKPKRTNII